MEETDLPVIRGGAAELPRPSRFSRLRVTPAALRSRPPPVQDVSHEDAIKKGQEGVRFSSVPSVAVPSAAAIQLKVRASETACSSIPHVC